MDLSRKLKTTISKGDTIEIDSWRDIDGKVCKLEWKVTDISIGDGPTESYDCFWYEDVSSKRKVKLCQTFQSLSYIILNSKDYKIKV